FSRSEPAAAPAALGELLNWYERAAPDRALFDRNVRDVSESLVRRHRFALSSSDVATLHRIQRAFFDAGPELRYSYPHRWFPSFADLVLATDDRGECWGHLSTLEAFQRLKHLEPRDTVVPDDADFDGSKAG